MQARYLIKLHRLAVQTRHGIPYARTYGRYETFFDGVPTGLNGFMVERQGPGDNSMQGDLHDRRIAAGSYPLATHASPVKDGFPRGAYRTYGYADTADASASPRPCIRLDGTHQRTGILIHTAGDFLHSVGCLNPTRALADGTVDLDWADSKARVIALIADLRARLGPAFPTQNHQPIPQAALVMTGEP